MESTIKSVFESIKARRLATIKKYNVKTGGTLEDVVSGKIKNAYLYVHAGGDRMLPITGANKQGDAWTTCNGISSWWCCCPDEEVFISA